MKVASATIKLAAIDKGRMKNCLKNVHTCPFLKVGLNMGRSRKIGNWLIADSPERYGPPHALQWTANAAIAEAFIRAVMAGTIRLMGVHAKSAGLVLSLHRVGCVVTVGAALAAS